MLFELGARWGTQLPLLPLICDPSGTRLLEGPLKNINALDATDSTDIFQFIYDLSENLSKEPEDANSYLKEVEILKNKSLGKEKKTAKPDTVYSNNNSSEFEGAEDIIKRKGKEEYPGDFEMQEYYIKNQKKALEGLQKEKPDDIDLDDFQKIRARAKREYPFNFEMRLYTEENQIESLRKLREI